MGNKASHANAAYFKSKLISNSAKLGWYNSVIQHVLNMFVKLGFFKNIMKKCD
jgi:hypothetical protein